MVGRTRSGRRKQKLLSNHQRSWIWGRNVVIETLRCGKWPVIELVLSTSLDEQIKNYCKERAAELEIAVKCLPSQNLTKQCRSAEHQGLLALMGEFPYTEQAQVLNSISEVPLIIILDSVQDPFNFGAMLRTFAAFGVDAVFIRDRNQVGVNSQVARSSAGAINQLPIIRVSDLAEAIKQFRQAGLRCFAATEKSDLVYTECDYCQGTVIVIGNEGSGVAEEILHLCDQQIAIPLAESIDSLNAAVAAGILVSEVQRQRQSKES